MCVCVVALLALATVSSQGSVNGVWDDVPSVVEVCKDVPNLCIRGGSKLTDGGMLSMVEQWCGEKCGVLVMIDPRIWFHVNRLSVHVLL